MLQCCERLLLQWLLLYLLIRLEVRQLDCHLTMSFVPLCFLLTMLCILWKLELWPTVSDVLAECQSQIQLCCLSKNWLQSHSVCIRKHSKVSKLFQLLSCMSLISEDFQHRVQCLCWQSSRVVHCLLLSLYMMIQSHQQQRVHKPKIQELMNMMYIMLHHSWLYMIHKLSDRTLFLHTSHQLQ